MVNDARGSKGALWCVGLAACQRASLNASALVGVLHYMKPSDRVSSACRTLMSCNSP